LEEYIQHMRRSLAEVERKLKPETVIIEAQPQGTNPEAQRLAQRILEAAQEGKGIDAVVLDVSKNFGLADYFVVLSGRSDRHVQGLANKIIESMEQNGSEPYSIQGMEQGHWVVIDAVDVVVHIFYEPLRSRYDIENLWLNADKVELPKLAAVKREPVLA
jgi:ribosome-associated protein